MLVCLGAALLAYFKPLGKRGGDTLLVDRTTNQLYVVMPGSGQLRPVYNLTSARLVLGNAGTPIAVKSDELNRMPKGQPIGIPGAPYATPVRRCAAVDVDAVRHRDQARERRADGRRRRSIVLPLITDALGGPDDARPGRCWCPTRTRTGWSPTTGRHAIDLSDRAVTSAVGIPVTAKATPDLGGAVQRAAQRGAVAAARGSRRRARRIPLACRRIW